MERLKQLIGILREDTEAMESLNRSIKAIVWFYTAVIWLLLLLTRLGAMPAL